jgi:hypothetical protein
MCARAARYPWGPATSPATSFSFLPRAASPRESCFRNTGRAGRPCRLVDGRSGILVDCLRCHYTTAIQVPGNALVNAATRTGGARRRTHQSITV